MLLNINGVSYHMNLKTQEMDKIAKGRGGVRRRMLFGDHKNTQNVNYTIIQREVIGIHSWCSGPNLL
jgi:hypothetical protein